MIQGSAALYASNPEGSRQTYKYFAPALSTARRLFAELNRDSRALSQFLVQGSRALGAIAERRDDLSALTRTPTSSWARSPSEQSALEQSLEAFPPALRQANTTFVNVRSFLDDLTPLVNEFKPATEDLAPFLRKLRPVAERSIPVFRDLRLAVNRSGPTNDITDSLRENPRIERRASRAVPQAITGFDASQPVIEFARPYMPDLMGFLSKFARGHVVLRRERPLRARFHGTGEPVPPLRDPADPNVLRPPPFRAATHGRARTDPAQPAVRRPRVRHLHPLPRRRDAADRRLQPVP